MAIPESSPYTRYSTTLAKPSGGNSNRLHDKIFQPPLTPSTPYYMSTALTPDQTSQSTSKRSRDVYDSFSNGGRDTARERDGCFNIRHTVGRAVSPPPLANTRYSLAGGFDTPTLAATALYEKSGNSGENEFRKRWDSGIDVGQEHDYFGGEGALGREQNGRSRTGAGYFQEPRQNGWGRFVFGLATSVATTVAGKMWNFCRESAFGGFHAGEGRGYDFSRPSQLHPDTTQGYHDRAGSFDGFGRSFTSVPGYFPREPDFSGDFEQDNTPIRPSKRLHTDTANGWLLVDGNLNTREASPRLTPRKVSNPLLGAGRPSASRASSRRSLIPITRRPSSHTAHANPLSLSQRCADHVNAMPAPHTQSHVERRASTASTRTPVSHSRNSSLASHPSTSNPSPLSPEAQKYLARKERQEKLNDKSMRKMNKQLQDLIRQGNAALGTKYNVEGELDDGALNDDDADEWEDAAAVGKW